MVHSSSRRRSFKERRALIACTRCRHLKKGCKQVGGNRCQRCDQTDQVCVYLDVASDPTAPRPPGASPTAVPDSPTLSASDPPSPVGEDFGIYREFSLSSEQSNEIPYAPHLQHLNVSPLLNSRPIPNVNARAARPPLRCGDAGDSPTDPHPFELSGQTPPENTYPFIQGNGVYNASRPPPPLSAPCGPPNNQDMTDPIYAHPYLPPHANFPPPSRTLGNDRMYIVPDTPYDTEAESRFVSLVDSPDCYTTFRPGTGIRSSSSPLLDIMKQPYYSPDDNLQFFPAETCDMCSYGVCSVHVLHSLDSTNWWASDDER